MIAEQYLKKIINPLIKLPKLDVGCSSVWHLFVLQVENREKFIKHMLDKGVKTDIHYPIPPHLSKCYTNLGFKEGSFPKTEYLSRHIVDLPIFNGMTQKEIDLVVEAVNQYGE